MAPARIFIDEIDVNPVIVSASGAVAADALLCVATLVQALTGSSSDYPSS